MTATAVPPTQTSERPVANRRPPPRRRHARRPRTFTSVDVMVLVGCAVSAVSFNWLVFARLTDGAGALGFIICSYLTFLLIFAVATADRLGRLIAIDRVMTVVVATGAIIVLVPLVSLVVYVFFRGLSALRFTFFTADQAGVTPVMPSTAGGGLHAVIGTIEQVGLALVWSLPLGLAAAVFLNESRSNWRRPVRIFVDAMSGLPSVVAGLFIYATLILPFAQFNDFFKGNGLMASLALAIVMLPTITRTVEVVLRLVPDGLREASLALGSSRARTVWSVVFPTARTGMTTAIVLGIARAVGETAPLLFTAFGTKLFNNNPLSGFQSSLPLFVYENVRLPDISAIERGFAGALVLMMMVLALFVLARIIGRDRTRRRVGPRVPVQTTDPNVSVAEEPLSP